MHTCSPEEEGHHLLCVSTLVVSAEFSLQFAPLARVVYSCPPACIQGNMALLTWQRFPVVKPGGYRQFSRQS